MIARLFEIGNSLREARLRRSISFAQAEQVTKIRSKYLRALEDEQFDQLPAPTYVKGFLQAYADYLGLDGRLYVDEYDSRFVSGEEWERRRRSRVRPARRTRGIQTSVVVVALAVIAIVTIVVSSAWSLGGGGSRRTPPPAHHHRGVRAPRGPGAYLRIDAIRGASSYVEVHRGGPAGRIVFEGTIASGSPALVLTAKEVGRDFWLDISSPRNVAVSVGGRRLAPRGSRPETLSVTPTGVHAG
jgi:hypothetical protein